MLTFLNLERSVLILLSRLKVFFLVFTNQGTITNVIVSGVSIFLTL
jgi:hypothetical protein